MQLRKPLISLGLLAAVSLATAHAAETPQRQYTENVSGVQEAVKLPSLAATDDRVALAYTTGDAILKLKQGAGQGFPNTTELGETSNPTYFNHAVATGGRPGVFHSAWINDGEQVLYKATDGSDRTVASGQAFAHFVDVAVASGGRIYVLWRDIPDDVPIYKISYSDDAGATWAAPIVVVEPSESRGRGRLAVGPNNALWLVYAGNDGDVYAGVWNGGNFSFEQVTDTGSYEADPTITVAPSGTVFAAWRSVNQGAFYGERTGNGSWSVQPLSTGGDAAGSIAIDADSSGNLHAAWSGNASGDWEIYYRVRPAGDTWSAPINVSDNGDVYDINAEVAGGSGSPIVGHVAFEVFRSDGVAIEYARVLTSGGTAAQPQPTPQPTPAPTPQPTPAPPPPADARAFPETGQYISGRIRQYWEANGGLPIFGLPLNAEAERQTLDGTYRMQLFERERLELHPEFQAPYDVLLGRLGGDILYGQGRPWETLPREQPQNGCQYFSETQHNVCEPFLSYWRSNGLDFGEAGVTFRESLALFGLPLTTPQVETNPDGDTVLTQWFERARFEYHPDNPDPYKVLLGRLGAESGQQ